MSGHRSPGVGFGPRRGIIGHAPGGSKWTIRVERDPDKTVWRWDYRIYENGEDIWSQYHYTMTPFRSVNPSGSAITHRGALRKARKHLKRLIARREFLERVRKEKAVYDA